ncbi:2-keto-4-pentenoate hydratase [Tropicimonas isoalkanivorans]|uniref:2-keto-4-pentenoate hydratase n=1 Tax=Tropicimonas isoalkanivorans TaxID=441112 RepID=A0A1I1HXW9_9RHOB|nr:hypothetical protein [Tropicimonas isoalkanivorans]SFC25800.1 2-keto-4-pentenoate hydratase [Tropicimonas isoalkanivorans]
MTTDSLTDVLINARRSGCSVPAVADLSLPPDEDAADRVQLEVVRSLGPIAGYKVFQVGEGEGKWGAIPATRILSSPAVTDAVASEQKVEAEIAFRFQQDLPPRDDGSAYSKEDVWAAVGSAFAAFELLQSRLIASSIDPLLVRADSMGNSGLVIGKEVPKWRSAVKPDVAVRLDIGDATAVDQRGGHPSGDPAHPLVWLVNALSRTDHWIKAGDIVTTGAFGGSHVIRPGETTIASIEGFESIRFSIERV